MRYSCYTTTCRRMPSVGRFLPRLRPLLSGPFFVSGAPLDDPRASFSYVPYVERDGRVDRGIEPHCDDLLLWQSRGRHVERSARLGVCSKLWLRWLRLRLRRVSSIWFGS